MTTLDSFDFKGKKALVRVDFNVPLDKDFNVTDDTRIRAAIPTIKKILNDGGSVILMSHLGRPKDLPEEKFSLKHIIPAVEKLAGKKIKFVNDCVGEEVKKQTQSLQSGEILLLENLRFYKHETAGDPNFSKQLADLGDVYVNDAFGTAHRAHASTTIMAKYFSKETRMFGYLMQSEVDNINKVIDNPVKPYVAIMGGAKVSGKIMIIENLLNKVDHLIIGGGMTFTFINALGGKTGASLVEGDKLETALHILNAAKEKGVQIHLPVDCIAADSFSNEAKTITCNINEIPDNWMGLDIGPESVKLFQEVILKSKTILWNGPMGVFEMEKFANGTNQIAQVLAVATKNGSFTLVGGGDSVAAVNQTGMADKVSYVSTGGGALLEYMEGNSLPGIKAVLD